MLTKPLAAALGTVSVFGLFTGLGIVYGLRATMTPRLVATSSPAGHGDVATPPPDIRRVPPAPRVPIAEPPPHVRRPERLAAEPTARTPRRRSLALRQAPSPETVSEEQAAAQLRETMDTFAGRMKGEATDPHWAAGAQTEINARAAEMIPEGATLLAAHCRTSLCRLEVGFETLDARDQAFDVLPLLVPWDSDGFVHADADDPSKVVVYAAREGRTLPNPH